MYIGINFPIHESQGIKYYLIISPDTEEIDVYELKGGGKKNYELAQKGHDFNHAFSFAECSTITIDFKEIW